MPPKPVLPPNLPSSAACPASLKTIAPFIQRAAEVKTADPVVAYWCLYNAARLGLPLAKTNDTEAKQYIEQILKYLESSKGALAGEKAISDTDVACQRIEQFAGRIFSSADNEDRAGAATKMTAKKFLAAANFMQLLAIFDRDHDVADKIKYAKWKASDIAKALREGRVPLAGSIGDVASSPGSDDPFAGTGGFPDTSAGPRSESQGQFTSGGISPPRAGTIPHTPSAWSTVATPGPDYSEERKKETTHWPQESPTPTSSNGRLSGNIGGDEDEAEESDAGYWSTASTPGTAFVDGKQFFATQQQRPVPPSVPPPASQSSYVSGSSASSTSRPASDPSVRRVRFTESTAGGSDDLNDPAPMSPIHEHPELPDESNIKTPMPMNGSTAPRRFSQEQAQRPTNLLPAGRDRMEGLPSVIDDEPGRDITDPSYRRSSNSPPKNDASTKPAGSTTSSASADTSSSRESSRTLPPTILTSQRERRPSQDRAPPVIDTNISHTRSRSNSGSTPAGPPSGLTPMTRDRKETAGPPTIQPQTRERRNSLTNGRTPVTPDNGPPTATPTGSRERRNSLTRRDGPPTVSTTSAGKERRTSGGSTDLPDRSFLAPPSGAPSRQNHSRQSSPSRPAQVPLPDSATSSLNPSPDLGQHVKPLPGFSAPARPTGVSTTSARPIAPPVQTVSAPIVDFKAMSEAKKHAQFAISALNFEDVATARKELLEALARLGG